MRFALETGAAGLLDPCTLADLAARAEDSGWDGFFLEDYLMYGGRCDTPTYDPWVCLSAMAAKTTRIRLGTSVTPVPRRRPWKLAMEAVSVDRLSGGRLILGVGLGDGAEAGFRATGEPSNARGLAERLDEALAIIDGLWSGEPVHFEGVHYQVDNLRLAAKPVQEPRSPIWIGGDTRVPRVRRRMARWDGCCGGPDRLSMSPQQVSEFLDFVEQERGTREGYDVIVDGWADLPTLEEQSAAGATWAWTWIDPHDFDRIGDTIAQGPPRLA